MGVLTGDDEGVALSPQLPLVETLASLGVFRVEEVVEEILSLRGENVTLCALADLSAAESHVLIAILVHLGEDDAIELCLVKPRHRSNLHDMSVAILHACSTAKIDGLLCCDAWLPGRVSE